jgi:hypothetical protein
MLGAWGRANNIDATIKQGIEDAIAARGHHEVVTSLRAFDRAAFAKRNGIPVSPHSFGNPTYEQVAKGIGMVRAGASLEKFLRFQGAHIGRNAERFNRRLAILNNQRNNDAVIRLVQDDPCDNPDPFFCYDETPDPSDCKQNPDGSFNCVLIGPTVVPDPPKLEPDPFSPEWTCGYGGQSWGAMFELGMAFLMLVFPEIAALFMLGVFAWEWWQAANGC